MAKGKWYVVTWQGEGEEKISRYWYYIFGRCEDPKVVEIIESINKKEPDYSKLQEFIDEKGSMLFEDAIFHRADMHGSEKAIRSLGASQFEVSFTGNLTARQVLGQWDSRTDAELRFDEIKESNVEEKYAFMLEIIDRMTLDEGGMGECPCLEL